VKFALFEAGEPLTELARGEIEGIPHTPIFRVQSLALPSQKPLPVNSIGDQSVALVFVIKWIEQYFPDLNFYAIGHRVVHGGNRFSQPVIVTNDVLVNLEKLDPLAPLHQPYNLAGIRLLRERYPTIPQIACFDTAFHSAWLEETQRLPLPEIYYQAGMRRYGFHGLSYEYITNQMRSLAPAAQRLVLAHLGSGASVCAVLNGKSIESSMGFSALDGLMMSTRCGSMDPAVIFHLHRKHGLAYGDIEQLLYKNSGLLGVSGISADMRDLLDSSLPQAQQAIKLFILSCVKFIGAMIAVLGGIDALVFSGGIGQHAPLVRAEICKHLAFLGISLDIEANNQDAECISTVQSTAPIFVLKTDEEIVIAQHCAQLLAKHSIS